MPSLIKRTDTLPNMQFIPCAAPFSYCTTPCMQGGILPQDPSLYHSVLLVNNAGQTGDLKFLWDQSLANIRDQMLLNVVSPTALTAAVTSTFMRWVQQTQCVCPGMHAECQCNGARMVPVLMLVLKSFPPHQLCWFYLHPLSSLHCRSSSCQEITVVDIASVSCNKPYEAFGIYAAGGSQTQMIITTRNSTPRLNSKCQMPQHLCY